MKLYNKIYKKYSSHPPNLGIGDWGLGIGDWAQSPCLCITVSQINQE